MARKEPTPATAKVLWGKAAERCSKCRARLSRQASDGHVFVVGINAHICAAEAGGPRFDASKSDDDNRHYDNLILLCEPHHTEVDNDAGLYTVEVLHKMKDDHEKWVETQLQEVMPTVGYSDLEVIISYLKGVEVKEGAEDYSLTQLKDKIAKNELTPSTERLIQMGLTQIPTITSYLNEFPDPQYGDRLKQIFVAKYGELRLQELSGDDLFYELVEVVHGPDADLLRTAAAIALITYFFERCDIFEK